MQEPRTQQAEDYPLARGGLASSRLSYQHYVLTARQGWMLNPTIVTALAKTECSYKDTKQSIQIADLATGNGIWMLEMADSYPKYNFTGLDISPDQYPPSSTLPDNVSFSSRNFDVFAQKIHPEFVAAFDVVHIRLLAGAVMNKDPQARNMMLVNLTKMLKPGGWLQWEEVVGSTGITCTVPDKRKGTIQTRRMVRHPHFLTLDKLMDGHWFEGLQWLKDRATHLRDFNEPIEAESDANSDAGSIESSEQGSDASESRYLEELEYIEPPIKRSSLQWETDLNSWVWTELLNSAAGFKMPNARELSVQGKKELEECLNEGNMFAYDWSIVIGRKPE